MLLGMFAHLCFGAFYDAVLPPGNLVLPITPEFCFYLSFYNYFCCFPPSRIFSSRVLIGSELRSLSFLFYVSVGVIAVLEECCVEERVSVAVIWMRKRRRL